MADFNGTILTTAGLNLLAQAQAGETLQFTQVVLGSGTWSSTMNPSSMTSLVYPSQTVPIQNISVVGDGTARLRFLISNSSLSVGYLLSEIGIYAQTQSSPNTLYAVTYANNPDFVPASGVTTIEDVIDIYTVVSNAQSVTAVINNSVMLATMQDLYTARPEFSSSTPTDTYAGKIWVSDTQPAQFYDGTTWQPFNAGLLNGYGVSATPTPNMLLPLNSNTQFPASVIPAMSLTVANALFVKGYGVSATPQPNTIPVSDSTGKIASGWLNLTQTPYWRVSVDETSGNDTTPTNFNVTRRFKYLSFGSIFWYIPYWGTWSALWEMQINCTSSQTVVGKVVYVDDSVYIYLNNTLITSVTGWGFHNTRFILPFNSGTNLIQLVYNNSGGNIAALDLEIDLPWSSMTFIPL
jgi:hypothetical protein